MKKPPKIMWGAWPSGEYPEGSLAIVELRICRDPQGQVWSIHTPMTTHDAEIMATWPGAGARAIAHAFLVEALRREAYMCLLAGLTKDENLVKDYVKATSQGKEAIEHELAVACMEVLQTSSPRIIPDIIREIMHMAQNQHNT